MTAKCALAPVRGVPCLERWSNKFGIVKLRDWTKLWILQLKLIDNDF